MHRHVFGEDIMNTAVLVKTFIYVMLLAIGYTGKRTGLFGRENSKFLNNVICFLTMPAAVINGFQGVEITLSLMAGLGIGLFTNTLLLFLGQFVSRKKSPGERVIYVFSSSCFNVANFALPFLTGLITANGFAAICMFDISVALMCYGVNVAIADARMGGDGKIRIKPLVKKVFTTPVFLTYLFLVTLALLHIQLPGLVLELTGVIGNANSFLAMLSIGILFEFKLPKAGRNIVVRLLSMRFAVCIAIAAAVYFLLPLPEDIKKALCVVLVAPCAGSAPLLTENAGADGSIAAAINSVCIPISIALMATFLSVL